MRRWRTRCCATPRSATPAPQGLVTASAPIKPGYKADLILIDLNDAAYLPYNSAARQLVYTEAGRGVDSVMVDGRMVVEQRVVKTIDEEALRREVGRLMRHFIADYERGGGVAPRRAAAHARRPSPRLGAKMSAWSGSFRGRAKSEALDRCAKF